MTDSYDMFTGATPPTVAGAPQQSKGGRIEDKVDEAGYFNVTAGTVLRSPKDTYTVKGALGKGVFSTVVLCTSESNPDVEVAVKVLRNNDVMRRAGEKELEILKELGNHNHIIKLVDSFDLEQLHLVLVFERMSMNLRETLDRFGKRVGINFDAVRAYSSQLFSALAKLKTMGIVHADLKPDNILVSSDLNRVALADLGSAFRLTDVDAGLPTPYMVSRYYRSPEIIMGLQYGCEADMWALGATIYELATGNLLFTGTTNNDMLKIMQEILGPVPNAMIRRHIRSYIDKLELEPHFDEETMKFKQHEADPVTGKVIRKLVRHKEPEANVSILGRLSAKMSDSAEQDVKDLAQLISACLAFDPTHRLDPTKADTMTIFSRNNNKRAKVGA